MQVGRIQNLSFKSVQLKKEKTIASKCTAKRTYGKTRI